MLILLAVENYKTAQWSGLKTSQQVAWKYVNLFKSYYGENDIKTR
jgi:hypothetical protein